MGVIGLAMRRHSLEVHSTLFSSDSLCGDTPVQFRGQSIRSTCVGSADQTQLMITSGGAPRPLGVAGLAMRQLSLTAHLSAQWRGDRGQLNSSYIP